LEGVKDDPVVLLGAWHRTPSGIVASAVILKVSDMNDEGEVCTVDRGEQMMKALDAGGGVSRIADKCQLEITILGQAIRAECEAKEDRCEYSPREPTQ
jgi:hypothetical protein